jgi:phenylalanyl-tRNA synthetase beta chain
VLVSLKLIDSLFLNLPSKASANLATPCWERWDVKLFSEILTRQGFEVESTVLRGNDLNQVVVGRIQSAEKHPKADKLQVCQVQTSSGEVRQIVCGAANARAGLYVAVAVPGAILPNGLEIKTSKIRDVESHGMLCSREELGLPVDEARDGSGIWELHSEPSCGLPESELELKLGLPVMLALGLDDVLLELNVTPNRPDLLCHEGAARELCAGLKWAGVSGFEWKPWKQEWLAAPTAADIARDAAEKNHIETRAGAFVAQNDLGVPAFFVGLDHVKVNTTPAWLRNSLEALGQKSINSVVDACNLILLCFAQPNHAFDLVKIAPQHDGKRSLRLRFAHSGEMFLGLDSKERNLVATDCVVADATAPQALLGVIGGDHSKVDLSSESLVLEFANPHPVLVRRTSRRHGRKTDSSFAFEKGIDVWRRFESAQKLVGLLNALQTSSASSVKYVGSIFASTGSSRSAEAQAFFPIDASGKEPALSKNTSEFNIPFNADDVKSRVGDNLVSFEKQLAILESLGFEIGKPSGSGAVDVVVPSWRRLDVVGAADLVEEIVRVVGIDHVPAHPLSAAGKLLPDDVHLSLFENSAQRLVSLGYHETSGFHFMRADDFSKLNLQSINACGEPVALLNPIIKDEPLMQSTLVGGLLRKVAHNINYGTKRGQLFELSRTFQNTDLSGRRVFSSNGDGVGLAAALAEKTPSELYEYAPQLAFPLSREQSAAERPGETPRVCAVVFGSQEEKEWLNSEERPWVLHMIAAHVAELMNVYGLRVEFKSLPADHPMRGALHPGRSAAVLAEFQGNTIHLGWVGQFHPATLRNFEIDSECLGFELNLGVAVEKVVLRQREGGNSPKTKIGLQNSSGVRLPSVERDFAFLVSEDLTADALVQSVRLAVESDALAQKKIPARVVAVKIFDVYRGQGVSAGHKSVALRVTLLPTERTLVEADISAVTEAVVGRVSRECAAQLRG